MNVKRIIRRVTDNDYLFTIFTKILEQKNAMKHIILCK